ncbi:MAG: aldo/keto reductase [Desulfobacteraceae bacterium]|nr:MAG: aldo/keto reductase [Desulfobacteraceae bacterium]
MKTNSIPTVEFGTTGRMVTRVGLGGEGVLRTTGKTDAARKVIRSAIAEGITYFDSARVYSDSEVYYGGIWTQDSRARSRVFQASKSASRDKAGARQDLEDTLGRLGVDHLDLWQIHDVRTAEDLSVISGPGGALEAFMEAKEAGKTRFIGVTGHHDPDILARAVRQWPVDSVMMPVNPVEEVLGGFLTKTLPAALDKGIAVIAMKIFGAGHYIAPHLGVTPELLLRYALSKPITVAIAGCSGVDEVETLAAAGRLDQPPGKTELRKLMAPFKEDARRLAFYRHFG